MVFEDYGRAVQYFNEVLAYDENIIEARFNRGISLFKEDKKEEGCVDFQYYEDQGLEIAITTFEELCRSE